MIAVAKRTAADKTRAMVRAVIIMPNVNAQRCATKRPWVETKPSSAHSLKEELEALNFICKPTVNKHLVSGRPEAGKQGLPPFENSDRMWLGLPYANFELARGAQSYKQKLP